MFEIDFYTKILPSLPSILSSPRYCVSCRQLRKGSRQEGTVHVREIKNKLDGCLCDFDQARRTFINNTFNTHPYIETNLCLTAVVFTLFIDYNQCSIVHATTIKDNPVDSSNPAPLHPVRVISSLSFEDLPLAVRSSDDQSVLSRILK